MTSPKLEKIQINVIIDQLEAELEQLHRQQVGKAKKFAQNLRPELTDEDLLNPDNFKDVISNPDFMYEDGIAAGILSAKLAVRAHLKAICSSD